MLSQSLKKERKRGPNITGYYFPRISAFLPCCENILVGWQYLDEPSGNSLQMVTESLCRPSPKTADNFMPICGQLCDICMLRRGKRADSNTDGIITFVCLSSKAAAEKHNERTFIHSLLHPVTIYYYLHDTEEGLGGQSRLHLVALFVYFSN